MQKQSMGRIFSFSFFQIGSALLPRLAVNLQFSCLSLLSIHGYKHMTLGFTFKSTIMIVKNHAYFIFHFIIKICIIMQNICKKFLSMRLEITLISIKQSPMVRLWTVVATHFKIILLQMLFLKNIQLTFSYFEGQCK